MGDLKLSAKIRKRGDKKDNSEKVPAILYGKGIKNVMIWVDQQTFNKIFDEAGESTLIDLAVDDDDKDPRRVLIYDVQYNPVAGNVEHADFYQVRMDEEIETDIELDFVGEAPAVKELGGVLVKNIDSINIRCLPADLPKEIIADISVLATFNDHIRIKDLEVSDKVQINLDSETVIAVVSPPRSEEELEELETEVEEDISQVEGMEEKVEGEEGEEPASPEDTKDAEAKEGDAKEGAKPEEKPKAADKKESKLS